MTLDSNGLTEPDHARQSGRILRVIICIIGVYAAIALAILPFAGQPGPEIPGIVPLFVAGVLVTELSTSYLLFARFHDERSWSLLLLGCAYLYSAMMTIPHVLTFPGAVLRGPPLLGTSQSTAWIFLSWIAGYALLVLIAVVVEARFGDHLVSRDRAGRAIVGALAAVLAAVITLVCVATIGVDRLPALVGGSSWTGLNETVSFVALVMLGASIAIILLAIGERNELFLWLSLALTAMAAANILSAAAGGRYTVGWSIGRLSWVVSACVLFLFFMALFARQQRLLARAKETLEQRIRERTVDLQEMVNQRDLLLREVYHRVKNNLQIVDSLIHFQRSRLKDDDAKRGLDDLRRRVYALGLVHHQLMESQNLSSFDIRPFLEELCGNLAVSSGADQRGIRVVVEAEPIRTDLDFAVPLGLVVTELVTNAFRHGFPDGRTGRVTISFLRCSPDKVVLTVTDDGKMDTRSILASPGVGSRITRALVKQLDGEIDVVNEGGTRITVTARFAEAA